MHPVKALICVMGVAAACAGQASAASIVPSPVGTAHDPEGSFPWVSAPDFEMKFAVDTTSDQTGAYVPATITFTAVPTDGSEPVSASVPFTGNDMAPGVPVALHGLVDGQTYLLRYRLTADDGGFAPIEGTALDGAAFLADGRAPAEQNFDMTPDRTLTLGGVNRVSYFRRRSFGIDLQPTDAPGETDANSSPLSFVHLQGVNVPGLWGPCYAWSYLPGPDGSYICRRVSYTTGAGGVRTYAPVHWDVKDMADGFYWFRANAYDSASATSLSPFYPDNKFTPNATMGEARTVVVDTIRPRASLWITPGTTISWPTNPGASALVDTGRSQDATSGVESSTVDFGDGETAQLSPASPSVEHRWLPGDYSVRVTVTDRAGWQSSVTTRIRVTRSRVYWM